jgi:DNA-binding transcriptional MerR regulator
MSIGEVLGQLRGDFADITISKIRFLEDEGLIKPERTASGYRKFSREDVGRLRYVLSAQRDHYLPLRVIKEHLDAIDRGLEPPALGGGGPKVPRALVAAEGMPSPDAFRPDASEVRLSRRELLDAAGLEEEQLVQLEQFGLLGPRPGGSHYDGDALVVAKTVSEMARFGIEARHLRPFKAAAEREIGLVEQVVTPLVRQRNPTARRQAADNLGEMAHLGEQLRGALLRAALRSHTDGSR